MGSGSTKCLADTVLAFCLYQQREGDIGHNMKMIFELNKECTSIGKKKKMIFDLLPCEASPLTTCVTSGELL